MFFIKIYEEPGICRNHIHFTIKISTTENYKKFIRALSGRLAQVLKVKFLYRPYTKILEWGRHFKRAMGYVLQNKEEALGIKPYKARYKKGKKVKTDAARKTYPQGPSSSLINYS